MFTRIFSLIVFSFFIHANVFATKTVVTTLPEIKWVVDQLKAADTETISLLAGTEDPHFVDASPSFVLKIKKADLLVVNGLQLEMGWIPAAIEMAGNSNIQFQAKGYCDASQLIERAQVTPNYNRSLGDIHPMGNPHYTLSMSQMKRAAKKIAECLVTITPDQQEKIFERLATLETQLDQKLKEQQKKFEGLKDILVMTYHLEFIYFLQDVGIISAGTIEKIPGVLPSSSHLFQVSKTAKKKNVKLVLASLTHPRKYLEKFKSITKIPFLQLPMHLTSGFDSYWEYQEALTKSIINSVKN